MQLLFATTNPNKILEIREVLSMFARLKLRASCNGTHSAADDDIELLTLADLPPIPAPEETGATFWENAREKALAYARACGLTAAAEDSGLEIAALRGEPGVASARFLGPATPYAERFAEIYRRLEQVHGAIRSDARFVTALSVAQVLMDSDTIRFSSTHLLHARPRS